MRKPETIVRLCLALVLLAVVAAGTESRAESVQNKFRLKAGAQGQICVTCHVTFQDKLKDPYVHTPVKGGECTSCHNPHASSQPKMLEAESDKICFKCHRGVIPSRAKSTHKVVAEGKCTQCHDPHSSRIKANLVTAGNDLCFGCHKEMAEKVQKVKFKHAPVEKSCTLCHSPHGSDQSNALLKEAVPTLCLKCHKTNNPTFQKQHMNYPVGKARCTSCHDPHGSDRPGSLYTVVHKPVAGKMCGQCHADPNSPNPFATKRAGAELCKTCHSNMINEAFSKNRIHWPVADKTGCLHCHKPHAAPEKALLKAPLVKVCGECHADSLERMKRADTKHMPVQEGMCMSCHQPHASNNLFLFEQDTLMDVCATCHDFSKHKTHPVGGKAVDPRNKNLIVQCSSCHAAHGTENKHMLYWPTTSEQCVQCHSQYGR